MKWWLVILIAFLVIGSFIIIRSNSLDLKEDEGRSEFIFKFSRWIYDIFGNMKGIVGYAITQDWLPEEDINGNHS